MTTQQIKVLSVNISEKKGTIKHPVDEIILTTSGIQNDAHAGNWHRQVSLLSDESIKKFVRTSGRETGYGEFAENITLSGLDMNCTRPLDRFQIKDVVLEVTQIGKKCHGTNCAIFNETGDCVMPKEGIFARVVETGKIKPGDPVRYFPKVYKILIITLSDRASQGIYEDKSGPAVKNHIEKYFHEKGNKTETEINVIPDDPDKLEVLIKLAVQKKIDLIFTTGGTGLSPNDITIETVIPLLDKTIPGITEYIRVLYGATNPAALISRSVAGVIDRSLVFCLPGSVKAVEEYLQEITKVTQHLIYTINGLDLH